VETAFFVAGVCLLLGHQMDAIRLREWRVLPLADRLDDAVAGPGFIAVNAAVSAAMLWGVFLTVPGGMNRAVAVGLDLFFLAHLAKHLWLLRHPANPFRSAFSWTLIGGVAACGVLDLAFGG
jgi:hypothetical protein